ncbi:MAG: tRNA uridine-5-carboxymethylaminomethyl(34) synthesis GTPase MnmE [Candidatus Faecimonas sp.]|nr:tRNA uridine-5-carboxymethylaminomethyl(34) synthesis GTPase MnmE [Mycoplasmatota bacterium]MDY2908879.1 tRNA uridine-5-carboxymethylaminomethyl(34) synthesis GTPase MnmE [Candidatus Faecimonas sp.]
MNDTIVAISTALGVGAISIVRLSGKEAIKIVNSCFKGKDLSKVKSHTINYGHIIDKDEIIDEVLVSIMKEPKTYTTEDVVEINCHGGVISTKRILETMLTHGARLAEPGEFTKRAFLNGRIDLVKSEAVMDIIDSKSEEANKIALSQLSGSTSNMIKKFRESLKQLLASIEVNIDYPEYYDIEVVTKEKISKSIEEMKKDLEKVINESKNTTLIKEGIKTVIVGRPNVGKSSILNKLLEQEKAIVTDIAGTTRDIVEGEISLDGILLNIIDTAGIRSTDDIVEKIGVEKSLSMIDAADLVVVVLNNNEELTAEDQEILEKTKAKERIIVINKNDLSKKLDISRYNLKNVVETNANTTDGIKNLKKKIIELFQLETIKTKDYTYLTNARQIALAKKAYQSLTEAEAGINNDLPIDMVEIDLKNTFDFLGEIIGETYSEEILDHLFANFCVGK